MGRELVYGRDGLIAREAGDYARKKLAFIEFFAPPAIDATERKVHRFYIDLFAGPGLNVVRETKEEIEAGALTILRSRGHRRPDLSFTHAHLVNLDPADHQALRSRVDRLVAAHLCMVPAGNIEHHLGDANLLAKRLLARADKRDYVLVFADIEAPRQLPWETVRSLRTLGHESVDLYVLFPLEMGLNRLTSYQEMQPGHAEIITRFYGDETWRPILTNRITEAQGAQCRRELEELYLTKLRGLWQRAERVMQVKRGGERGLYRMIFATDHAAGAKIAEWAKKQADSTDQLGLGL